MRGAENQQMYKERLPIEVNALLHDNDIVGLTEINPYWCDWLTESHGLTKPPHKYKAVHDGDDCAIIWDSSKVQPIFPASPRKLTLSYNPGDIPDGANAARFNWRGFMSVDFQSVASPRVTFTVAITHSKRGNIREGPKQTFVGGNARQIMGGWAMRAMEKLLVNHHIPSLAAGNRQHMSFIMGDWNVIRGPFETYCRHAMRLAHADQIGCAALTADKRNLRDFAAVFFGHRQWTADPVKVDDWVYADLEGCAGENRQLFFSVRHEALQPAPPPPPLP